MDVISLTQKLLSFNTINPPGNEAEIARFTGSLLARNGFNVELHEFGGNRLHLVAGRGLSQQKPPFILSGHFDTVPLGAKDWTVDPFAGTVNSGRIWGRGSSDMKGAIASMLIASFEAFRESIPGGVRFILTAGEELGCQGIVSMADKGLIPGDASAVIVGEPTGNIPATGHKGALYLNASATGKTAHSSMPHLGDNAIYKVVDAIARIRQIDFAAEQDPLLGYPTLNIGKISGGMNINSVPDHAAFTIDVRSTTKMGHGTILDMIQEAAGKEITFEKLVDIGPVFTPIDHPFVKAVNFECGGSGLPFSLPYLTDGAILQKTLNAPVVILGPGEAGQAHQTDEWCDIEKLTESVRIYRNIITKWSKKE